MANTPSITEDLSSKLSIMEDPSPKLPVHRKYSVKEEGKANRSREFSINNEIAPSNLQKVKFDVLCLFVTYFLMILKEILIFL